MDAAFLELLTWYIYKLEFLTYIVLQRIGVRAIDKISTIKLSIKEKHGIAYVLDVDICGRVSGLLKTSNIPSKLKLKRQDVTSCLPCDKDTII